MMHRVTQMAQPHSTDNDSDMETEVDYDLELWGKKNKKNN